MVAACRSRRGSTLLELSTVLLVASVALALAVPSARRLGDRAAVVGAREAIVGMVSAARGAALDAGVAELVVDARADRVWVEAEGRERRELDLAREFGVDVGPPDAERARLRFGFLGLGVASSRTVTVRRGSAARSLTVSAYGRVRRW
ncbi:MAG: hypothetical protein PVI57_19485 [Gemmatimonadota bacterium]|jgi:Tfp pilus assembly major pilin PilA